MSKNRKNCCFSGKSVSICKNSYSLLALGDSIAVGDGTTNGSYVTLFANNWNETYTGQMTVTNLAQSGSTSTQLLASLKETATQTAIRQADIITINVGGNDISTEYNSPGNPFQLTQRFQCVKERFLKNMQHILQIICQLNPKAIVLVNGLYNPFFFFGFVERIAKRFLNEWNCCLKEIVEECGFIFVPTRRVLNQCNKREWLASDNVHLSDVGACLLADEYSCMIIGCNKKTLASLLE
ncbi:MAG: GDSL-type esterase/lipase family protein [Bacillaceae bacterium]